MNSRPTIDRRSLLKQSSLGFSALAMSAMLRQECAATPVLATDRPKAKSVIFLFMEGGVSQVDSYDHKPLLERKDGQDPRQTIGELEKTQFQNIGKVMKSPWQFRQWGECGTWASDLFPHINEEMDELCVIRSMTSKFPEHTGANYLLHSGHGLQGRPSMGAWATYGLGSQNEDLPGYVVLNGGQIPSGGLDNFSNGFLPASFQGSLLHANGTPLANIRPNEGDPQLQAMKRTLARRLNESSLELTGEVDAIESAIRNAELAARMQLAVPELIDLGQETEETHEMYGLNAEYAHTKTYGRACMIARRLVERGVRFVEVLIPLVNGYQRWDAHGNVVDNHSTNARAVDQPIAALLKDLRRRGMLDDTLVVWSGEFGRTPFAQGGAGRDHNEHGFSLWLAGGGVKGGMTYGATDEWGYKAVEDRLEIHDLHATILHQLGIDHTELTYRFSGRDIRLTDVYGRVIEEIL